MTTLREDLANRSEEWLWLGLLGVSLALFLQRLDLSRLADRVKSLERQAHRRQEMTRLEDDIAPE